MQSQRATPTPSRPQRLHHSINRTPPLVVQANGCASESSYHDYIGEGSTLRLAVQLNRHAWEGSVPSSLSLFEFWLLTDAYEEDFYFNVDHFEERVPEITATLVEATLATTPSRTGGTLTLTTSRTATVPTATRTSITSTTAKE